MGFTDDCPIIKAMRGTKKNILVIVIAQGVQNEKAVTLVKFN